MLEEVNLPRADYRIGNDLEFIASNPSLSCRFYLKPPTGGSIGDGAVDQQLRTEGLAYVKLEYVGNNNYVIKSQAGKVYFDTP